ncbi:MAG: chalcone isomerase family protein [Burkholderiaceae bacterium]
MRKRLAVLAIALGIGVTGAAHAQSIELEGVKFEPTVQVGGQTLQLNGAGIRTRVFFKVYVAGLYVPQKSTDANALLAQKGPRRVAIHMLRNVDADTFATSLADGLKANHSEQQLAAVKAQTDALTATLKAIGEAKKGDAIFFEFTPEAGTRVLVNGQPRGDPIPGEEFFTAVLRIWLGNRPADADLKKGMVGG